MVGVDLSGKYLRCKQYGTPLDLSSANLQGADLWSAKLQGAKLSQAQLQGTYIGYDSFRVLSFEGRINQQADKETEEENLINQYKPLNNKEKQALIDQIKKINPCWITDAIKRIQQDGDTLDLSKTKTGKYNKQ